MTCRERFRRVMSFQSVDRAPLWDAEGITEQAVRRWCSEGFLPGHNVAVNYIEPDNDRIQAHPANPSPDVWVQKWAEGSGQAAPDGPLVFTINYGNDGEATAQDIDLTDPGITVGHGMVGIIGMGPVHHLPHPLGAFDLVRTCHIVEDLVPYDPHEHSFVVFVSIHHLLP